MFIQKMALGISLVWAILAYAISYFNLGDGILFICFLVSFLALAVCLMDKLINWRLPSTHSTESLEANG